MTRPRLGALALVLLLALPSCKSGWLTLSSPTTTVPGAGAAGGPGGTGLVAPSAPSTTAIRAADLRAGGPPPWSGPPISSGVARQVGVEEWREAPNRNDARLVMPADAFLTPSQTVRRAGVTGGWGLAWDDVGSGKPGVLPSGEYCPTCGRAVIGMAATAVAADKAAVQRLPVTVQWNDGSVVGYSREPNQARQFKATLFVAGQGRTYELWTYLSLLHLENLIAQLRFVANAP